jgi:sulfonate transport system substrate-binding protein
MKRIYGLFLLFIVLTITTAFSEEKKLFEIRLQTMTGFNEYDVADALGYFKDEGLAIKYIGIIADAGKAIQATITGDSDLFQNHPNTVIKAILAGVKIKITSPGMVDNPEFIHMGYFVKDGGNFQTAEDVKKKPVKFAVSSINSCTDLLALEWARINKVPKDNLIFVIMPDAEQEQALKQGLVDIVDLHPPFIKKIQINGGARKLFSSWDVTGSPGGGASIRGFSEKFIKAHPKEVAGFTRALVRAHHWINSHQKEAIDIVAKKYGWDPAKMTTFWYDENDWVLDSYMQSWIDAMVRQGQLDKGQIKPSGIYTNAYNPYYINRNKLKETENKKDKNLEVYQNLKKEGKLQG